MYSLIFYSSLFTFQNSPSKCQHGTTNGVWLFVVANFNLQTIISIWEIHETMWVKIGWWNSLILTPALSFVCYSNLFAYFGLSFSFSPRLCYSNFPAASLPWRPLPSVPPDNRWHPRKIYSVMFCICVFWTACCSVLRVLWLRSKVIYRLKLGGGAAPHWAISLYTTLNQEKSISLPFGSNKTICLTLMYQKVCTKSKDWGNSDLTESTKCQE